MGVLDDIQTRSVPTRLRLFGTAGVVVTPVDGSAATVTADLGEEVAGYEDTPDGTTLVGVRKCWVASDPASVYGGVATIGPGDTVTVDSDVYVVRLAGLAGGMWELTLARRLLADAARPDYRDVGGYRRQR